MDRPSAIWKYSVTEEVGSYTNLTNTGADFNFISAVTDVFYVGFDRRYVGLFCNLTTNGSYSGMTFKHLANDSVWTSLQLIDSYAFSESKYLRWRLPTDCVKTQFTSTFPYSATPPDNRERYWIQISASAVTTMAVISELKILPYVTYATPTGVSNFLQIKKDFDYNTRPTDLAVEDLIRNAEARIDYRTRKSWRFNAVVEDTQPNIVDYNRYGIYPRYKNLAKVYSVSMWNGSAWDTLTEGRNNDYFVNYDLGIIYFTRLFLLPAAYGMTGRYFLFGFGEYKNSVKLDYAYGRDPEIDPEFYIVRDIAIKLTAKDIIKNYDYTGLTVGGTDNIPLSEKARLMEDEAEARLDELVSISVF